MSLPAIQSRLISACKAAGRDPSDVTLIAVSKVQPLELVRAVLVEGQKVFGENYVQEAQGKWPDLRAEFGPLEVHMIGPLQTNKAKVAMDLFDAIHTLDRPSLATKLANLAQQRGSCPKLFIQINTGEEPQKAGVLPADTDAFIATARALDLPITGLMCIPPEGEDSTPHFNALAALAARNGLTGLSMGMSGDFEAAIAAGATHVRVGSAIFGARDYS
ncbi:YggS family pyridoxal phosphate-dependent enzyme [Pseudorhodobacter turbinis]|uniref:Pyridoxal phosphate homeostasis protein n=1 Tax=Pseudorhodobacter turbinis TaxID=2500533 RepID=A0A4P8EGM4_9RHOB|nr:YggS family pyridoxal phosphate-dependent enzyme [Pseudorhodobacter turbinis]QCO55685.1 YggS family pyridoxal phosphate-dependent enzyme [Pseudorhodobacter turbinis]